MSLTVARIEFGPGGMTSVDEEFSEGNDWKIGRDGSLLLIQTEDQEVNRGVKSVAQFAPGHWLSVQQTREPMDGGDCDTDTDTGAIRAAAYEPYEPFDVRCTSTTRLTDGEVRCERVSRHLDDHTGAMPNRGGRFSWPYGRSW